VEVKGNGRILRNEQLYDLYCPPNGIGVWKKRPMGRGGGESEIGEACGMYDCRREIVTGFWCGNMKERGHLEDLRVVERVIPKYIV